MRPLLRHLTQLVCLLMIDEFLLPPSLLFVFVTGACYTKGFPTTVSVYNISQSFVIGACWIPDRFSVVGSWAYCIPKPLDA